MSKYYVIQPGHAGLPRGWMGADLIAVCRQLRRVPLPHEVKVFGDRDRSSGTAHMLHGGVLDGRNEVPMSELLRVAKEYGGAAAVMQLRHHIRAHNATSPSAPTQHTPVPLPSTPAPLASTRAAVPEAESAASQFATEAAQQTQVSFEVAAILQCRRM